MNNAVFYTCAVGFFIGVALGVTELLSWHVALLCAVIAVAVMLLCWRHNERHRFAVLGCGVFVAVVAMLLSHGSWRTPEEYVLAPMLGSDVTITGTVVREVEHREKTSHVYIDVDGVGILAYADRHTVASFGDVVALSGVLQLPEAFVTDLGRTFHYPEYLQSKGVMYVLYYPDLAVTQLRSAVSVQSVLYDIKHRFRTSLQSLLSPPQLPLAEGVLLGVNGVLGAYWEEVFRKSGIIHIVVLSGYNIMLVVLFVKYVLAFFLSYRARLIVGFAAIVLFALLVGLSATVVRASVMASLLLLLQLGGNTGNVLRGLMLAGVGMLLWNPLLLLYDPGFQLSFLATAGLILLAPHIERLVWYVPEVFLVREFLVATLTTQLFVLPLLLYQIGEVSLVAVVVNVLVLPFVSLAMLLSFLAGVVGLVVPALGAFVAFFAHVVLTYILRVAELFAQLPLASVAVPPFPIWILFLLYALGAWWLYYIQRPLRQGSFAPGWTIEEESVVLERQKNR